MPSNTWDTGSLGSERLASSMEELTRVIRDRGSNVGNVELGGLRRIYSAGAGSFVVPVDKRRLVTYFTVSGTPGATITFDIDSNVIFEAIIPADGNFHKHIPVPLYSLEVVTMTGGTTWYLVGLFGEDINAR